MITNAIYKKAITQPLTMEWDDAETIRLLKSRDEEVFGQLFKAHFKPLRQYAFTFVQEQQVAEDIVQTIFFKLWERIEVLNFSDSVPAYLYRAVYNESLNALKHNKVRRLYQSWLHRTMNHQTDSAHRKLHQDELEKRLHKAIAGLPQQCRTIFQMSRFEGLRYQEIGTRLGISPKTVENQMSKALRILRARLIEFLPGIALFLTSLISHSNH
ncbi:MAG TPA: RNA polymerase sigma-70 factor [Puia sp.]|uniref:RNA polymerase sigma-70 factor n=1 Tax=Puia sp. TaxID=2045100 RepID=UPI002CACE232|nr:RNA polymerase sigma-70 factor [Puia sp.]HVU95804.1 RNA polymerase sigma-70 factor [Puia sp.]